MNKIFKYRDITDDNTIRLLENFELFFNDPKNFNDPFDSYIELDSKGSLLDWEKYFTEIGLPPNVIKINLDQFKVRVLQPNDFDSDIYKELTSELKIACFSEEPDNILLWSHYAKDHSGICIGFKVYSEFNSQCVHLNPNDLNAIPRTPKGVIPLIKVKYNCNMPSPFNRFKDDTRRLMEFPMQKSKKWEYEKEYRIILYNKLIINNPVHFAPNEITDIIFGIKTEDNHKNKILKIISNYPKRGNWINLYECKRKKGKYSLTFVQI